MKCNWLQNQKNSNATCRYCGSHKDLTKDHIQPSSRGGTSSYKNYQVLCKYCNQKKSNLTDFEVATIFRDLKEKGVWYDWEKKYYDWLVYIEIKRDEYGKGPLNWNDCI